ncbi:MAG: TIGR03067 domain-containing protein [Planctomycetes bacterium]|nr:TIGR03067 domain-containing protein [Planctomycetota bacterium]
MYLAQCLLFGCCLLVAQDQDPAPIEAARKKLAGAWAVVSLEKEGKPVADKAVKSMRWEFDGDKLTILAGKKTIASGTIKLSSGQTPLVWDYREGKDIISPYDSAIYEFAGDTLKVCVSADRKKRPAKFESKDAWLFVLKRAGPVQPPKEPEKKEPEKKDDEKKDKDAKKDTGKLLFDGKSLTGWKSAKFGGEGEVRVEKGAIVMERGEAMTGITYTKGDFPKMNYEVTLEGKKLAGNDFFCTTTFPVGDNFCSLVVGGWGGTVVGLSSLNFADASENETTKYQTFKQDKWYRIRIQVVPDRIKAWIDDKPFVDVETKDRKISIRIECDLCRPFGVATWRTAGAVRDIRVQTLRTP